MQKYSDFLHNKLIFCLVAIFLILLEKLLIDASIPAHQKLPPRQHTPVVSNISDTMSAADYEVIKKRMADSVLQDDPHKALSDLTSLTNIDPKVERYCHGLTHEIGHTAYTKYGFTQALLYQDDLCGSGYMHGVIEAYFINTKDLTRQLPTVCTGITLAAESGKCYHGVGHGVMYYTGNNIPLSLYYCDSYKDASQRAYCSEGVFMENFNSDDRFHPSSYLHKDNPFYPCPKQTAFYKDACYFYAPDYYLHLHPYDYKGALMWCDTAEAGFISRCISGVGSRTMKYNMGSPKVAESVCMTADAKEKVVTCIDGMMSYFLVQFHSLTQAKNICGAFEKENQPACNQAIANRSSWFTN